MLRRIESCRKLAQGALGNLESRDKHNHAKCLMSAISSDSSKELVQDIKVAIENVKNIGQSSSHGEAVRGTFAARYYSENVMIVASLGTDESDVGAVTTCRECGCGVQNTTVLKTCVPVVDAMQVEGEQSDTTRCPLCPGRALAQGSDLLKHVWGSCGNDECSGSGATRERYQQYCHHGCFGCGVRLDIPIRFDCCLKKGTTDAYEAYSPLWYEPDCPTILKGETRSQPTEQQVRAMAEPPKYEAAAATVVSADRNRMELREITKPTDQELLIRSGQVRQDSYGNARQDTPKEETLRTRYRFENYGT